VPERLDRVTVRTQNGEVTVSWESREELLSLLAEEDPTDIRASFDAAGASRPVELRGDQRTALTHLLGDTDTRSDLSELYIALNMGEPSEWLVAEWEAGDAESGRGFGSQNWRWRWAHWRERRYEHDDHQHCGFCHTNIEDDAVTEAWLTLGDDDVERWVCAGCFEKLHARFGWRVDPDSGRV
jgi:hypothetical protein